MSHSARDRSENRTEIRRWVLVTDHVDGRSRSAVAAMRAVAAGGYLPAITVSGGRSAAAASRACADVVAVPRAGSAGYPAAIERELATRRYAAVLPASDATLVALRLPGAELVDKSVLPARVAAAGLAMPETQQFGGPLSLAQAAADLCYPIVVKPAIKRRRSAVAVRVDSPAELAELTPLLDVGPVVVQPFHTGQVRAVCGVLHGGDLRAVAHQTYERIWPPHCGTASSAITTDPDTALEARLPALLSGHDGVFQVQLVDDLVIDVNPRVYGSMPLAVAAGANLPAIACAAAGGRDDALVRARAGVRYRWLEGDIRRILRDLRTRDLGTLAALRAFRPRHGTAHSIESLFDPGPVLSRAAAVLSRGTR